MRIKGFEIYKVILVWLFAAIFVFPYIVKLVHIYSESQVFECHMSVGCSHGEDTHKHNESSEHNSNDCFICQFTLFCFTEAKLHHSVSVIRELESIINPAYQEEVYIPYFTANNLRAPPFC